MHRRLGALAVVLLATCGGDDEIPPPTYSWGEACDAVGNSVCARAYVCGYDTGGNCVGGFINGCCVQYGNCEEDSGWTDEDVDDCQYAVGNMACSNFETGTLPPACTD